MIIAGASDIHGRLAHSMPECDVLALVGDIVPLYSTAEDWKSWQELQWVEYKFVRWLKRQVFKKCLICWGNHDIAACDPATRKLLKEILEAIPNVVVLDHDQPTTVIDGILFSAYPYTPTIQQRNWAFSLPRGDHRVQLALDHYIHKETDVLLTHGPPQGFLDGKGQEHYGCAELASKIVEVSPQLVLCGHIHTHRGEREWMWNKLGKETRLINVSICDDNYSEKGAKVQTYELN